MQAAFFKLANVIPYEQADEYMKAYAKKAYGKKGDEVVKKNWDAHRHRPSPAWVEIPVPAEWANATTGAVPVKVEATEYFDEVIQPILAQEGDKLPVSKLDPAGVVPTGTTKYEKRGIAVMVPEWQIDNCIQCCQCAMVCARTPASAPIWWTTRARPTRPRRSPPSRRWARSSRA